MEYREPKFYPFHDLGGMYIHTNYESFKSNLGSFGQYDSELAVLANAIVIRQEQREREITMLIKEIYGEDASLQALVQWFTNPQGFFARYEKETWQTLVEEEVLPKFGHWAHAQLDNAELAAVKLEMLLQDIMNSLEKINEQGTINLENLQEQKVAIQKRIALLTDKGQDASPAVVRGAVLSLKGFIWEAFIARFIIAALREIGEHPEFDLILHGPARNVDLSVVLKNISFSFNIKSASTDTFMGYYGVTLFSGTLQTIIDNIVNFTSTDAVEAFKYYLLNISRMKAFPLSGVSAQGLGHTKDGANLIKAILGTYATIFIGEGRTFNSNAEVDIYQQADVFITFDRAYLKSEVLRQLIDGDMESFLKISYGSSYNWEQFDRRKRQLMTWTGGRYDVVKNRAFMTGGIKDLLSQSAQVKLRLLTK